MKISITGNLGSGKSTISKILSSHLHMGLVSTGTIQRNIAKQMNIDTLELNILSESEIKIDNKIDNYLISLRNTKDSMIIDSRLAWHFLPETFKIFLYVDVNIAAERVTRDTRRLSENYNDIIYAKEKLLQRQQSENRRFVKLYNVNCLDYVNYDCIIDTSYASPSSISNLILNCYEKWTTHSKFIKYWFSPKNLFPTHSIKQLAGESAHNLCNMVKNNGYDENYPALILMNNVFYYIYDGHKRVSASIFSGLDLIPINIIAKDSDEIIPGITVRDYVKAETSLSLIYDWEDCHKFRFKDYEHF